jgi:hypothetical protein
MAPQAGKTASTAGATSSAGVTSSGGTLSSGGTTAQSGGAVSDGNAGATGKAGEPVGTGSTSMGGGGSGSTHPCDAPGLEWKSGTKTNFESYPDPSSPTCVEFGCDWVGQLAFCPDEKSEIWVSEHNIVAAFPSAGFEGHDLCLRSGSTSLIVSVLSTCADEDCSGCCTANRGSADALIDIEKYTNARFGVPDGPIQWADLGPNSAACQ